ncbi:MULTISPECIES: tetratricopeptide repeat protein [unclassified Bosea (in: a-proteobacteria)]|uniref:tetratricopeptide repeat protein n=1 Tax=unclassified Bosea (in: a-proteobacteria) TaxID=2653178 RepID=UPI000F7540C9|nr:MULTISPECIES: tetratricopeptide repeat protein [unclassified Bosea (in: a-proteobacteria)]AZO76737.1 hypothetical protein BLM15_03260 [Bosea sp. Tri-49]RXT21570.1 hypothetical protein B5U98_13875 [Bosea sp. Tri-39]RXT31909.1 hypothetical protein B5U99_24720 [Bosea sp. Tri-54]
MFGRILAIILLVCSSMTVAAQVPGSTHAEALALERESKRLSLAGHLSEAERVALQALALCPHAQPYVEACISSLSSLLGSFKAKAGALAEAEVYLNASLAAARRHFAPNDPWIAQRLRQLGALYRQQLRFTDAAHALQQAVGIVELSQGTNPQLFADCLDEFIAVLIQGNSFERAASIGQSALAVFRSDRRISPNTAVSIAVSVADALFYLKRYEEAERSYFHAVNLPTDGSKRSESVYSHALLQIGQVMAITGRHEQAVAQLLKTVTMATGISRGRNKDLALGCSLLADIYLERGNPVQAESFSRCAVGVRTALTGSQDGTLAPLLVNLGLALSRQGRQADAEPVLRQALAIIESASAPNDADLVKARAALADIRRSGDDAGSTLEGLASNLQADRSRDTGVSIAQVEADVAFALNRIGQTEQAKAVLAQAVRSAALDWDRLPTAVGALHRTIADELFARGDVAGARSHLGYATDRLMAEANEHPSDYAESLNGLARQLEKDGQFERGAAVVSRALDVSDANAASTNQRAQEAAALASRLYNRGLYESAIGLWTRIARLAEAAGNGSLLSTAEASAGASFYQLGRSREAALLLKRAYERETASPKADAVTIAHYASQLAFSLLAAGQPQSAEEFAERSLAIHKRLFGSDHPATATSYHLSGHVWLARFRYAEAETFFREALAIRGRVLGVTHSDYAASLAGLASTLEERGRFSEAETARRSAVVIEALSKGGPQREAGRRLADLARHLLLQGRIAEAEQLARRSLALLDKAVGAEDPTLAPRLDILAQIAELRGDYVSALAIRQRIVALHEHASGADDSALVAPLLDLTRTFLRLDRNDEAVALLARAELLIRSDPVPRMPEADTLRETSVLVDVAQGRLAQAEAKVREALAVKVGMLGEDHPLLASMLNNLGYIAVQQQRFAEAEPSLAKARQLIERIGGRMHPVLGPILANLVLVHEALGKSVEAAEAKAQLEAIISAIGQDGKKQIRWL